MFLRLGLASLPNLGSPLMDVLAFLTAAMVALFAYLGGRGSATAQLQTALNDAFRSLTGELQKERAALIARDLKREGELTNLKQANDSLRHQLERHGIDVTDNSGVTYKELNYVDLPPDDWTA